MFKASMLFLIIGLNTPIAKEKMP